MTTTPYHFPETFCIARRSSPEAINKVVSSSSLGRQDTGSVGRIPGQSKHPLYKTWTGMKDRCKNANATSYHLWGGRGIRVCDRWSSSFRAFLEDMGPKPSPDHTLDRINPDGHYCPENCRWATPQEQTDNRRRSGGLPDTEDMEEKIWSWVKERDSFTTSEVKRAFCISTEDWKSRWKLRLSGSSDHPVVRQLAFNRRLRESFTPEARGPVLRWTHRPPEY